MNEAFAGLATYTIANRSLRLDVLREAGPRIVRLIGASGRNLFAEMPQKTWDVPNGTFRIYGGHRLWHAPEAFPRTYQPDNEGLLFEALPNGCVLRRHESDCGITKEMRISLDPEAARVSIDHQLQNSGVWPIEVAPWAITQMRFGGTAIIPLQPKHVDPNGMLPNRHLVFWPYTNIADPRFSFGNEYVLVHTADRAPTKIGTLCERGWMAYALEGEVFVKRFTAYPHMLHPDGNSNIEVFTDSQQLELETLAPLVRLNPGEVVGHREEWLVYSGFDGPIDADWLQRLHDRVEAQP